MPPPIGNAVVTIFETQRVAAMGEYYTIYIEDWLDETARLNATGERHLGGIIRRLGDSGAPIKVEPLGVDEVDAARKATIIDLLVKAGIPQATALARVTNGYTRAEGLRERYIEAVYFRGIGSLYGNTSFNNNFTGGYGGGFNGGGFGGGGFGGFR